MDVGRPRDFQSARGNHPQLSGRPAIVESDMGERFHAEICSHTAIGNDLRTQRAFVSFQEPAWKYNLAIGLLLCGWLVTMAGGFGLWRLCTNPSEWDIRSVWHILQHRPQEVGPFLRGVLHWPALISAGIALAATGWFVGRERWSISCFAFAFAVVGALWAVASV